MTFKILELFGSASLQGLPNSGRRNFGVPPRGAFDLDCHQLANALVGNSEECRTLELSQAALKVEVLRSGTLSWVGAGAWQGTKSFQAGQVVSFAFPANGVRSYLSAVGGLRTTSLIGLGAIIEARDEVLLDRTLSGSPQFDGELRVYPGTHASHLNWTAFLRDSYVVSFESNRMGVRLKAANPIAHEIRLPSEPSDVGVVQVPGSGHPIILGPDGPTIGGYPRIACVAEIDLPRLAQLAPGNVATFVEIDRAEGWLLLERSRTNLEQVKNLIRLQARA